MDSYFVHWPTFRYEQQIHDMNDLPDTHDENDEKDLPHYELTRIIALSARKRSSKVCASC